MAQMLQAPIEGYEDAIVVPPINANNFELKQPLINLVQSNKFTGRQDPHNHLRFFNKSLQRLDLQTLRQCPHHASRNTPTMYFYNSLNSNDQDALDSAVGGNFLDKMPQEGLAIIESKSKVRYSRSRANDSRGYFSIPIDHKDAENKDFYVPKGTFAYLFGDSFSSCLANLDRMLKRCEDTKLALNWEKSHFMVKEGIVLGHKICKNEVEVDNAKVD
ncbi:hypothetical protein Tco_0313650 [Tanacetum coccineum]